MPASSSSGSPIGHRDVMVNRLVVLLEERGWVRAPAPHATAELIVDELLDAVDSRHLVELRRDGWTLQHPLTCRPNLFACPVNRVVTLRAPERVELGAYVVTLDRDRHALVLGERVS